MKNYELNFVKWAQLLAQLCPMATCEYMEETKTAKFYDGEFTIYVTHLFAISIYNKYGKLVLEKKDMPIEGIETMVKWCFNEKGTFAKTIAKNERKEKMKNFFAKLIA